MPLACGQLCKHVSCQHRLGSCSETTTLDELSDVSVGPRRPVRCRRHPVGRPQTEASQTHGHSGDDLRIFLLSFIAGQPPPEVEPSLTSCPHRDVRHTKLTGWQRPQIVVTPRTCTFKKDLPCTLEIWNASALHKCSSLPMRSALNLWTNSALPSGVFPRS